MRTTVTIDDALYEQALEVADPDMDRSDLFREAVRVFVRVQSARRLAALGGSAPDMTLPTRQRAGTPHAEYGHTVHESAPPYGVPAGSGT